jgi:hypothetical protein
MSASFQRRSSGGGCRSVSQSAEQLDVDVGEAVAQRPIFAPRLDYGHRRLQPAPGGVESTVPQRRHGGIGVRRNACETRCVTPAAEDVLRCGDCLAKTPCEQERGQVKVSKRRRLKRSVTRSRGTVESLGGRVDRFSRAPDIGLGDGQCPCHYQGCQVGQLVRAQRGRRGYRFVRAGRHRQLHPSECLERLLHKGIR